MMTETEFFEKLEGFLNYHLVFNQHKAYYETVEKYVPEEKFDPLDWNGKDDWREAVATNQLYELQIYPDTPIGFNVYYAPTLRKLIDFYTMEVEQGRAVWYEVKNEETK